MGDNMSVSKVEIDNRDIKQLQRAFDEADYILMKKYQYELSSYQVVPISDEIKNMEITKHTRLFHVESIAYDKNEDNFTKLSNVYNALTAVKGSVILILDSNNDQVDFYIGTKTLTEKDIHIAHKTLEKALQGNYPGCVINNQTNSKIKRVVDNIFKFKDDSSSEEHRVVSAVNGISSVREVNTFGARKDFSQGIEKLIDSMRGEIYTFVLVADPIDQKQISEIRHGYEQLYTKLIPFASADISLGYNKGQTLTDSITKGTADTISESLTLSQSHTHTTSTSKTTSAGGGVSFILSANASKSKTTTETDSYTEGKAETKGNSTSKSLNIGISDAITMGESKSLLIKTEDKSVKNLLERIDAQLGRLNICGDLGMWNCAAYFIADDIQTSRTAASTYQALIRGENSGLEAITINTWSYDEHNEYANEDYFNFVEYLKKLTHPRINVSTSIPSVTPTSLISSSELTLQAGLPQKSVSGLAVSQYATFGREVISRNNEFISSIKLGKVHHMGVDEYLVVNIDIQSLASHTFITGSTGAGKSNVIYKIVDELSKKNIPFLVIESAKGEYKHIFGSREDVYVFGTNASKTPLLKINPFRFPADIHVLEHIDRMIEIFNVCWPMYAAMPAVLKDAVERAYRAAGWDLDNSINHYGEELFPDFNDLLIQLYSVINDSDFSQELKSNYIGALVTRVKSLTNGINGQIFVSDEIDNTILFDRNTIIDLSRVASSETKSMIMGILIMRLQEYRMSEGGINKPLKHITVLEEAHNLLKRTSTEQSTEISNILGKSVEMLANSIAEMRTYGEGFIIADQSPNMLDMSVIRNTNTKIILRLPDFSDRQLVGKSASLTEEQINELSKLPVGVAAVFQNNWLEPVLCHVDKHKDLKTMYTYKSKESFSKDIKLKRTLVQCLLCNIVGEKVEYILDDLIERLHKSNLPTESKLSVIRALKRNDNTSISKVSEPISKLFDSKGIFENARYAQSIEEWNEIIVMGTSMNLLKLDQQYTNIVLQCIIREKSYSDLSLIEMYEKWTESMRGDIL
jgi:DNA helicase HerA-like ATPase